MLIAFPSTYRKRSHKGRGATSPPVPPIAGPVLTEASFIPGDALTLFFDPDVQLVGFDPSGIVVNDPDSGSSFVATEGASVVSGFVFTVSMEVTGPSVGTARTVSAGGGTGIVSAVTGGPWAGVVDFPLDPAGSADLAGSAETDGERGAA